MNHRLWLCIALVGALHTPASANRYPLNFEANPAAAERADYTAVMDRLRTLSHSAQLEVSVSLGLLQYQQGFQYPIRIRLEDRFPAGHAAIAYVQLYATPIGFSQDLVIDLDALRKASANNKWVDVERVFFHEMTHAVLNDAVGGNASLRLPMWVQEGLAQYVSKEGDPRLKDAAAQLQKRQIKEMSFDLRRPYEGLAYPQYYLAVRYLLEKHSVNAVQGLVRYLIEGKAVEQAISESTGLSYETFLQNAGHYMKEEFLDEAIRL